MKWTRKIRVIVLSLLVATLAVGAAACGGGGDGSSSTGTSSSDSGSDSFSVAKYEKLVAAAEGGPRSTPALAYPGVGVSDWKGASFAFTFNPWTNKWTRQPDMRHGRWYPGQVELPDGRIGVLAGEDESGSGAMNTELEVFKPAKRLGGVGSWTWYPAGTRSTVSAALLRAPERPGHARRPERRRLRLAVLQPPRRIRLGDRLGLDRPAGHGDGSPDRQCRAAPRWPEEARRTWPSPAVSPTPRKDQDLDRHRREHDADASWPHWASTNGPLSRPNGAALPALNVARSNFNIVLLPDGSLAAVGGAAGIAGDEGQNYMGSPPDQRLKQIEMYKPGVDRRWSSARRSASGAAITRRR